MQHVLSCKVMQCDAHFLQPVGAVGGSRNLLQASLAVVLGLKLDLPGTICNEILAQNLIGIITQLVMQRVQSDVRLTESIHVPEAQVLEPCAGQSSTGSEVS
jgi:hypothetical protein